MAYGGAELWQWPDLDDGTEDGAEGFQPVLRPGEEPPRQEDQEDSDARVRERRQEAERLVTEAEQQAEQIRQAAREEGRAEALRETSSRLETALEESIAEQTAAFERASEMVLKQIESAAEARLEEIELELAGLVATMAEKVVRRTVEADNEVVLDVVRATIEQAAGADRFTVRVSAPDEALVREATAELLAVADGAEKLEVVADEAIGPAGCIVETERGRFDARIETQLELLDDEIGRVLGGGEG